MTRPFDGGYRLPFLLIAGFRRLIDDLHMQLAAEGFPEMRPSYGFALQAIGRDGATSSEIAQRLGVTKQAAGKTIDAMESHGLVDRMADPDDRRQKQVRLSARGSEILARSGEVLSAIVGEWADVIGEANVARMIDDLQRVTGSTRLLDTPGWLDEG